jgi:hypothetical protein
LAFDEEQISAANAHQFGHYRLATHPDGTPVELGRGAMGITFKAFDTVLGNAVALKVIDERIAATPKRGNVSCAKLVPPRGSGTPMSPRSFITGRARRTLNAFMRWNWSRAKRWKRAYNAVDDSRQI